MLESRVKCLDKPFRYKKRPQSTMKIATDVAILSIDSISSAKMELSADVYLIHEWIDRNCAWKPLPGKKSRVSHILKKYSLSQKSEHSY